VPTDGHARAASAYYESTIGEFLAASTESILGRLVAADTFAQLENQQKLAWLEEIGILRDALAQINGTLYLEFEVPRLGTRIDAVVITGPAIIPIEFKCGEKAFNIDAYNQSWDYGLDLKNFHLASHGPQIFPLLVATLAAKGDDLWQQPHLDGVRPPRRATPVELHAAFIEGVGLATGGPIDAFAWGRAPYQPTPTIIEAARALYSRHSVEAITRNDAGAKNLRTTSGAVEEIIERSRGNREKSIVFLTGVPGAGKTLVGLNLATRRRTFGEARAVFLSGNQPLVSVLQEALTRDELQRRKGVRKGVIRQEVKPFIQNIHHFRDEGIRNSSTPYDHVVIFDEAQRAWNRRKTVDFMKRRKGNATFSQSEPEFLISYLDRHRDWAVIICLVGGGQEIHDGEAGIGAWLEALEQHYPGWRPYISGELTDSEYAAGDALKSLATRAQVTSDNRLHLATSMRSFRSEKVSAFVKALLDCDGSAARRTLQEISARYPLVATRDLGRAKAWIRQRARGTEQYGLVASSQAMRLKPHAIDVRVSVDPIHWFLADRTDTRSSYYLEDAATEFQVQGLEVDWACVTWDADLRLQSGSWRYYSFRGNRWENVKTPDRQRYLLNAYRVLLTRARQGMVIFVPLGDGGDPTRQSSFYDETFSYLTALGVNTV
jgi:Schlafen group 3, DNA/RNA helicase domain